MAQRRMGFAADRGWCCGGVSQGHRQRRRPQAREREIEADLRSLASPYRTAEAFGVEEIIDPRETRPYLCRFIDAAQGRLQTTLGPKPKFECALEPIGAIRRRGKVASPP